MLLKPACFLLKKRAGDTSCRVTQIEKLIEIVKNSRFSEHRGGHHAKPGVADHQAVRAGRPVDMICGFSASTAERIYSLTMRVPGNIFLQKGIIALTRMSPVPPGSALDDGNGFPLKNPTVKKACPAEQ